MEKLGNGLNRALARLGLDWLQHRDEILQAVRQFLESRGLGDQVEIGLQRDILWLAARSAPVRQELSLLQGELLAHLQAQWGSRIQQIKILRGRRP